MTGQRKKALVVCPGRGTYNSSELGYLAAHHGARSEYVARVDNYRESEGQTTVTDLDALQTYSTSIHTRGDNASALINTCAYCDYLSIDRDQYDVVAITGNSMGWYISLGCSGALGEMETLTLINTMGTLMHQTLIGGQVVYPLVDHRWKPIAGRREAVCALLAEIAAKAGRSLHVSIELGGMLVLAGDTRSLGELMRQLEPDDRFPMKLKNHAAFHTPLQHDVMLEARERLAKVCFAQPEVPLIDGRGKIWFPYSCDPASLWDYTLGHQLIAPYDFTTAIQVALKELAPDCVISLGPGNTLGGAIGQAVVALSWQRMTSKQAFQRRQKTEPFVLSMGLPEQRALVTSPA